MTGSGPVLDKGYVDLYSIPRMTETRARRLVERFGTPERVLGAGRGDLLEVEGIDAELASAIRAYERTPETGDRLRRAEDAGVFSVTVAEAGYPSGLRGLADVPPVLFVRGEIREEDRLAVALVGTRRPTHYGRQVAGKMAAEMARHGVTVVSGLARGIDTCAHAGALEAGGRTLAVLGCGVDVVYPPENRKLYDAIPTRGAVLSEFPLGMEPLAMNFPKRNRVVSGLAQAVVAVEAAERSGVMNTVAWAADQGRDVFAVPGRVTDVTSQGTNRLLRDGARLALSAEDVLRELGVALHLEERQKIDVSELEQPVLDFLSGDPLHVDEIGQGVGMPMSRLLGVLMELEVKGLVRQLPGKLFVKQA